MGFTLKTTGVFAVLLFLLHGTTVMADPAPEGLGAQDSALADSVEPQAGAALSAPAPDSAEDSTIADYQNAIAEQESIAGPFDAELSEMHFGLGRTLQHRYRFHEAMDAYRHAMHLNRVNNGVYSLSQEPMLRGIIASQSALGLLDEASDSYDQLFWLYLKSYGEDDPRLLPLLDELSRWHLQVYNNSGLRDDVYHLHMARGLSTRGVDIAAKHYGDSDLRLVPLLKNEALSNYFLSIHQKSYPGPAGFEDTAPMFEGFPKSRWFPQELFWNRSFYQTGRRAGQRIIYILEDNPAATTADRARGYAAMGDLMLLFNQQDSAIKAYRQAITLLNKDESARPLLEELFGMPKMLPKPLLTEAITTVQAQPESNPGDIPDTQDGSTATLTEPLSQPPVAKYVMVAVDVSEKGLTDNLSTLEIHPKDDEDGEAMVSRARRTLSSSRFRPRFDHGDPVQTKALPVKVLMY